MQVIALDYSEYVGKIVIGRDQARHAARGMKTVVDRQRTRAQ